MHIEHYEKDLRYSDRELLTLARKLGKLATYCKRVKDEASVIRVEAERRDTKKNTDGYKVMINVTLPGKMFRAESRKPTVIEAVDRCIEKLEPQLIKYKDMHTGKGLAKANRKQKLGRNRAPRKRA